MLAQDAGVDPADLTLEELAETEVVYAAAKREQRLKDAASWVTIVTGAEIRQHGHRTLADVLRSVPSFTVSDDRNYSYVGVRGFGRPGDYNTRLLLLVDGVRVNDGIYDMAPVGADFPVDVELIDRIEVVRGPAASLYGNSAFFAVVNVITRRGRGLGGEVAASGGSYGSGRARATYGRLLPNGLEVAGSVTLAGSRGQDLYFPELDTPADNFGVAEDADHEDYQSVYGTASRGGLRFAALHAARTKEVPTGAYGTILGDAHNWTRDDRTFLSLGYESAPRRGLGWSARAHYGRYDYRAEYAYEPPDGLYRDRARGEWLAAEWNLNVAAGARHELTFGGELREDFRQDQDFARMDPFELQVDVGDSAFSGGLYAQDEMQIAPGLVAHVGLRHDRHHHFAARTTPRLGLVWSADDATTVKALYGAAFRAPNEYELHYYDTTGVLRPERIRTFEVVVERRLAPESRLVATAYSNRIDGLLSLRSDAAGELYFANMEKVRADGAELALEGRLRGVHGRLSYSYQDARQAEGPWLDNSARHLAKLALRTPLLRGRLWAALDTSVSSARRTLAGGRAGAFLLSNLTLNAPELLGPIDVSATVYNAFDARYGDPGSEEHRQDLIPQDRRSFRVRASWRF